MKERPILFTGPMVRAIIEGRKTVTRRVMKYQPHEDASVTVGNYNVTVVDRHGEQQPGPEAFGAWWSDGERGCICPHGQPGDQLWVRETWGLQVRSYGGGAGEFIVYRATNPDAIYCRSSEGREYPVKWKPSIHMHRHSSRILLEITAVRIERLQDISEEQARAEGYPAERECETGGSGLDAWLWFRSLWGEINGPEAFTANPWVWVIEFKRVTP
ncbi:hypothetical protein AO965_05910 [Pseudomonas aeruginosa]|uniref:hypothetical protein n=1 Tax=Pseudomonas aeruginosa TaxID=287 RepID=UPI00071B19DD|nr:hypothetical protein [Pseudomonas aeruginosa]KSH33165.1 hypothetical protein AO965_05910 [Pseudomonas aeruginosa]